MELLVAGYTPEQIVERYDHLTREDIQAYLAYAKKLSSSRFEFAPIDDHRVSSVVQFKTM